jgi:branched-chain amino acid transport system permease protein
MGQVVVDTLIRGSELALLALGMTLVFGVVRFANVAQVEFATLGAYFTLLAGSVVGGSLLMDSIIGIVVGGLVAVVLYRAVFVKLLKSGSAMAMIGSLALSILLRALIQTITGPDPRMLDLPLERGTDVLGATVTPSQLRMVIISVAVLAAVTALLRFTPLGRAMRAVSTNRDLAAAAGIDVGRITDLVWLIAGVLGALAGVLLAIDTEVSIDMGFSLLLPVFAVALLGGLGSPGGAIAAGYLLAFVEALVLKVDWGHLVGSSSALMPIDYRAAIGFVLLIAVLIVRPQGMFGREARRA